MNESFSVKNNCLRNHCLNIVFFNSDAEVLILNKVYIEDKETLIDLSILKTNDFQARALYLNEGEHAYGIIGFD